MRYFLACLLLVGCDVVGPSGMDGTWRLEGSAGICEIYSSLAVSGGSSRFVALGSLWDAIDRPVTFRGDRSTLTGGGFSFAIEQVGEGQIGGTWTCEGSAGEWSMRRT